MDVFEFEIGAGVVEGGATGPLRRFSIAASMASRSVMGEGGVEC